MRCTNWDGLSGVLNKLSERTAAAAVETFSQLPKHTRNTLPDGVKITYLIISHLLSFCPNLSVDNFSYWYCASLLTLLAKAEGKNHLRLTFSLASITGFPFLPSFLQQRTSSVQGLNMNALVKRLLVHLPPTWYHAFDFQCIFVHSSDLL